LNDLPNRLSRAAFEGLHTELKLRICYRLTENDAVTQVVITAEEIRSVTSAQITVSAAVIDVETSGGILRETVFNVGHG
jgi:hypothetical protein